MFEKSIEFASSERGMLTPRLHSRKSIAQASEHSNHTYQSYGSMADRNKARNSIKESKPRQDKYFVNEDIRKDLHKTIKNITIVGSTTSRNAEGPPTSKTNADQKTIQSSISFSIKEATSPR